jgi:hypothetical protein
MTLRPRILAIVLAAALCPEAAQAQPYAESGGWRFDNFPDLTLPWDIYRDSFIGIPPTRDPASSAFDALFYDQIYKSELSKEGNCYGMSLLSLMILKKGGHLGYCLPLPQYSGDAFGDAGPADPGLKRAVNIMHGHQVNLPTLQFILDAIGKNKNRDAAYALQSFHFYKLKNDPTLVSITKSLSPSDGGHTMVAYAADPPGGGNRRIWVYDPNRTWADPSDRKWYTDPPVKSYITVNGTSWNFEMADGTTWSGSPASGGNLMIIPISVTGPHSRSPASLGDGIIGQILTTIFISGSDAKIEQVTDAEGRRLYKPGTVEIDTDPATGMQRMLPWYPSDQGRGRQGALLFFFHLGGSASTLNIKVAAGEEGYRLRALGPRGMITVAARGGKGSEQITLRHAGTLEPQLVLSNERGASDYDVHFAHVAQPRERVHILRARNLRAPKGATVELAAMDRSRALSLASPTASIEYDLELRAMTRKGEEVLSRPGAGQNAADTRIVRPSSWYDLKARDVLYRRAADRSSRP